jgi:hypothetical protein
MNRLERNCALLGALLNTFAALALVADASWSESFAQNLSNSHLLRMSVLLLLIYLIGWLTRLKSGWVHAHLTVWLVLSLTCVGTFLSCLIWLHFERLDVPFEAHVDRLSVATYFLTMVAIAWTWFNWAQIKNRKTPLKADAVGANSTREGHIELVAEGSTIQIKKAEAGGFFRRLFSPKWITVLAALAVLAWGIYEVTKKAVTVNVFSSQRKLEDMGLSGISITNQILDRVIELETSLPSTNQHHFRTAAVEDIPEIEIPETKISTKTFIQFIS